MQLRRSRKNIAQQRTLAASDIHHLLEPREVVSLEQRRTGPRNTLGHYTIEDCRVVGMAGQVLEEALTEDSFEGRLAGAHRLRELPQRTPEKRCCQKHPAVVLRLGMIRSQNLSKRRISVAALRCAFEHLQTGERAQQSLQCIRMRAAIGCQFCDSLGPSGKQVGNAEIHRRMDRLGGNYAWENVFEWVGRHFPLLKNLSKGQEPGEHCKVYDPGFKPNLSAIPPSSPSSSLILVVCAASPSLRSLQLVRSE